MLTFSVLVSERRSIYVQVFTLPDNNSHSDVQFDLETERKVWFGLIKKFTHNQKINSVSFYVFLFNFLLIG